MTNPPTAGPETAATCEARVCIVIAPAISARGTNAGIRACRVGPLTAPTEKLKNVTA
jgi:hypothetical protein